MRLFRVTIILISFLLLQNCSSHYNSLTETKGKFTEWPQAVTLGEGEMWSAPGFLWNQIQFMRFSLNKEEKDLHQAAVFYSLDHIKNGETTSWFSKKRLTKGKVRILYTFPTSDGYCRVYQALIHVNGATRHFTNKACRRLDLPWSFLK